MPSAFALPPTKPLDQMNSLRDMGRFPVPVHAGATLNVLLTITCTLLLVNNVDRGSPMLPFWIALVLAINLMPVVLLRAARWRAVAPMPPIEQMSFFGDQHRFADWVYLAACANMAFWIALSWTAYTLMPAAMDHWLLPALLVVAFLCTFAPVWLRLFRSRLSDGPGDRQAGYTGG